MATQAPAVTLTKSSTAGKTIVSSTTTPTLGTSGAATDTLASPTLDTSIYPIMGKKFPVGINISGAGSDVEADLQLQFSLNGTDWTEVQSKSEAVLTFTDLPAVDGTVTLTDHAGSSLVYTAKAAEDLGARQFNVTGTAATCTITFTGAPGTSGRITLVSEDGTSVAYNAAASSDFTSPTNQFKADVSNTDAAAKLKLAIDNAGGHNGKLTVVDNGAGVLTVTQLTKGSDGNTTVTETLANTTATSFTGGEFASAATSLKACIDAVAGHNGTITSADNGAGVLTLTQSLAGSTGNTAVTDALTNFTASNFTGGSGSSAGIIVSSDIKPNVTGVKLFVADLTDHVGIPYVRFLINSKSLNMGSFTAAWQFAFE
jgi:hypothetical protein